MKNRLQRSVIFTTLQAEWLESQAALLQISVSDLIRRILDEKMAKGKK